MDKHETRSLLSLYREGEMPLEAERFEAARKQAEADPALAAWWREEQEIDRVIAEKLGATPVPPGLRERLLATENVSLHARATWPRRLTLLAATIVLLAVFFGSWQGLFQPAVSLADYRDEMVSFVRLDPALALETTEMSKVSAYLEKHFAPGDLKLPASLRAIDPVGCRVLRFRGEDVALICFRRASGDLIHLFVINESAFPRLRHGLTDPQYAEQSDWTTATWKQNGHAYVLAGSGDRAALVKYLETS